MFQTIRNAFKIKEIRKRLFFTFLMLIVVRIGSQLPLPGVDPDVFQKLFGNTGDSLNFFNAITGGSFEQ
ncbi:MAG: preprotein translocase subunit SecY, partial [Candidatus Weimeria sp.]